MTLVLLTLGGDPARHDEAATALTVAGGAVDGLILPTDPSRAELDRALGVLDGRRLVVHSDAADLARVLRRLMRRDSLTTVETAVIPFAAVDFLGRFGISPDLASAAAVAVHGSLRTVGVLKDDSGNLVVDRAELRPWTGATAWVRAYVEDDRLCDGEIRSIRVIRGPSGGLSATVRTRFGRAKTLTGRGLTLACDDAAISSDGSARDQPRRKRIWWDEPEQWRLAVRPV